MSEKTGHEVRLARARQEVTQISTTDPDAGTMTSERQDDWLRRLEAL